VSCFTGAAPWCCRSRFHAKLPLLLGRPRQYREIRRNPRALEDDDRPPRTVRRAQVVLQDVRAVGVGALG